MPDLQVKYIIIVYQDQFGMWYTSVKPQGKESLKSECINSLVSLFRWIFKTVRNTEYP